MLRRFRPTIESILIGLLLVCVVILPSADVFSASPPNILTYQGRLLDSNGVPVASASASMIFELYTAVTGGTCVWSNSSASCASATARTVTLTDGLFSEDLGDTTIGAPYATIGDSIFGDNSALFLQVTIESEPLSPRKQITAAPYALNSETLDGINSTAFGLVANNLSDLASVSTARTNLGLGSLAVLSSVDVSDNTNLVGGSSLTLTGDTLDVDDVFLFNSGDSATGTYDFTSAVWLGASPFAFEGFTANDFETTFTITDPTADNIVTFQNGSGTLAFTSDIPAGASLWEVGTNGTLEDEAAVIVGSDIAFSYVASAGVGDLRVADDFETVDDGFFGGDLVVGALTSPTETISHAGFVLDGDDLFVSGTVGIEGDFYTDGTIFTSGAGITATGSFDLSILDEAGGAFYLLEGANVYLGIDTVGGSESITLGNATTNPDVSIVGSGDFDISGHVAVGGSATAASTSVLLLSESLSCASGCRGINTSIINTGGAISTDAYGGIFRVFSPVGGTASTVNIIGVGGTAVASGVATYLGPLVGASGSVSGSAAATLSDAYGLSGLVTLNTLTDVTGRAVGVYGDIRSSNSATFSGTVDALYGTFLPSNGTYTTVYGLEASVRGSGGTITNPTGAFLDVSPIGGVLFGSSGATTGLKIDASGENLSGDDVLNVYGANITATGGATGAGRNAYGVRATATGADSNYSGYFYGSLFQVDNDTTVNTNNAIATGAGELYAVGDIETDANIRVDGGSVTLRSAGGNANFDAATASSTGYALISLVGATGGDWQMYTSGGTATVTNGTTADLRWTLSDVGGDDEMRLTSTGDLFVDTATNNGGADIAEVYQVADLSLTAGDVVTLTSAGELIAGTSGAGALFGVVSTRPGVVLNNGSNDTFDADERMIALSGRVPTRVNLEGGVIVPGDPITVSSTSGEGMKATWPGMILGFALEAYTGTESPIEVFVNLQWNPAGTITSDGMAVGVNTNMILNASLDATSSDAVVDSSSLILRGSAFDVTASDRSFSVATNVTNTTDYRLSIKNTIDAEVAYINQDGGFSVAGDVVVGDHLYPSDRGTPQTNRYIFYDGSEGPGGDFMRTNASGWATGSYDFAEMFPSSDALKPGDVVAFGTKKEEVVRASGDARERLAGVVSTRPGFLAGENKAGDYPIALAGRVPTVVSGEGGEIQVGDALTISSIAGVAKKAKASGMIIGYALENFSGTSGTIVVYINTTYWNGSTQSANNQASGLNGSALSSLSAGGDVYIGANNILNVASISGIGQRWSIGENGDLRTEGILTTSIEGYNGDRVDTFTSTSLQVTVSLSGQAELQDGKVVIDLVKEDQNFLNIVSNLVPLRILTTPSAPIAVYVSERTPSGFKISQVNGSSSGVMVDWYVIGIRKGFEPASYLEIDEPVVPVEPDIEESDLTVPPQDVMEEVVTGPTFIGGSEEDPLVITEEEGVISEVINESPTGSISKEVEVVDEPADDAETSDQPVQIQAETPEETPAPSFTEPKEEESPSAESAPAENAVSESSPEDAVN